MMSRKYLIPILALFVLFTVSSVNILASAPVITVTTAPVYHPGQTVVVEGTAPPNTEIGISVYNPNDVVVCATVVNSTSSGTYEAVLFTFPSTATSEYPYGTYTVKVGTSNGFTNETTFQFEPELATVLVEVFNPQNLPVSGAKVCAVGTPYSAITNSTGEAVLMLPSGTYTIKVIPPSPYVETEKTLTVVAPQSYTLKFTVEVEELSIDLNEVMGFNSTGGIEVDITSPSPGSTITMLGNGTLYMYVIVYYAGMPVSNATVSAMFDNMMYTGVYNSTVGMYVIKIPIPNVQFEGDAVINATYSTFTASETMLLSIEYNQEQEIIELHNEINTLSTYLTGNVTELENRLAMLCSYLSGNVTKLDNEITALETEVSELSSYLSGNVTKLDNEIAMLSSYLSDNITYFKDEISTLEGQLQNDTTQLHTDTQEISMLSSYLSGNITYFNNEISKLNSSLTGQISTADSKISSITTLVYAGLILGVIALIIAIVAVVMVFRKVA